MAIIPRVPKHHHTREARLRLVNYTSVKMGNELVVLREMVPVCTVDVHSAVWAETFVGCRGFDLAMVSPSLFWSTAAWRTDLHGARPECQAPWGPSDPPMPPLC